jgi:hypothetical protein
MEPKFQLAQRRPTLAAARLHPSELRYLAQPILAAMETNAQDPHRK